MYYLNSILTTLCFIKVFLRVTNISLIVIKNDEQLGIVPLHCDKMAFIEDPDGYQIELIEVT